MKPQYLLLLLVTFVISSVHAEIYRWVDDTGAVIYSDTPREGAEKIDLPEVDTYESPDVGVSSDNSVPTGPSSSNSTIAYKSFVITQPVNDSTIRDNTGSVVVRVRSNPPLREGDEVVISLGDKTVRVKSTEHTFTEIERGAFVVSAHIEDSQGVTISAVAQSNINVKKSSVIQSNRAKAADAARNNRPPPTSPSN